MEQLSVFNKYFMLSNGVTVERYSCSELYKKLSEMNVFERRILIKQINDAYGYEAVNYDLFKQKYGTTEELNIIEEKENTSSNNSEFAKDYMKAYMSMLSNAM